MTQQENKALNSLLDSYDQLGIINRANQTQFPSQQPIKALLDLLKELLFPGYFGQEVLKDSDLSAVTKDRLSHLQVSLNREITRSFKWMKQDKSPAPSTKESPDQITQQLINSLANLRTQLKQDAEAMLAGDPAATSITEVILSYPGFQAILVHRIAHFLYQHQVPLIPRLMSEIIHSETGIDIHPGAQIGSYFCIDHGTGLVIGETAVIGNHVKLYQGVTLGAFSVSKSGQDQKRHPSIHDHVTIYARSTILGGNTIIGEHSTIGGNVWLTESIPAHSKIYVNFKSNIIKHAPDAE